MTSEARDIVERLMKATLYEGHGELSALPEEAAEEIRRLREALDEAIEFASQDHHVLTPAGEAMLERWKSARQALSPTGD